MLKLRNPDEISSMMPALDAHNALEDKSSNEAKNPTPVDSGGKNTPRTKSPKAKSPRSPKSKSPSTSKKQTIPAQAGQATATAVAGKKGKSEEEGSKKMLDILYFFFRY